MYAKDVEFQFSTDSERLFDTQNGSLATWASHFGTGTQQEQLRTLHRVSTFSH